MLDTNIVSHFVKGHELVTKRVTEARMASLCISVITEGELLFGLARRPKATRLRLLTSEFLRRVDVLPWDSAVAKHYARLRADLEGNGTSLADLDTLILGHAIAVNATLITNDQAFRATNKAPIEDWTT